MTEWYIQRCETLVYFGWRYQSEFTTFCSLKGIFVWGTGSQSFRVFTVLFYVWFFVGEGFELGALCSLGSLSSTWATSLALFALIILEIGSGWPGLWFSYFKLPTIARMTGMYHNVQLFFHRKMEPWSSQSQLGMAGLYHHAQLLVKFGSWELPSQAGLKTQILPQLPK
jgi:hypothetical protein